MPTPILNRTQQSAIDQARVEFKKDSDLSVRKATTEEIDQAINLGVRDISDLEQLVDRFVVSDGEGREVFVRLSSDSIIQTYNNHDRESATNEKARGWTFGGQLPFVGRAFQALRGVLHLMGAIHTAAGGRSDNILPEHRARAARQAAGAGLKHLGQAAVGGAIDAFVVSTGGTGAWAYVPELTARTAIASRESRGAEIANLGPQVVVLADGPLDGIPNQADGR